MGVEHSGTHGKVTSWIPPYNIGADELQVLLDDIQKHFVQFLNNQNKLEQARDSDAGDTGSSSDEELERLHSGPVPISVSQEWEEAYRQTRSEKAPQ
jgi:hypothetical protein